MVELVAATPRVRRIWGLPNTGTPVAGEPPPTRDSRTVEVVVARGRRWIGGVSGGVGGAESGTPPGDAGAVELVVAKVLRLPKTVAGDASAPRGSRVVELVPASWWSWRGVLRWRLTRMVELVVSRP